MSHEIGVYINLIYRNKTSYVSKHSYLTYLQYIMMMYYAFIVDVRGYVVCHKRVSELRGFSCKHRMALSSRCPVKLEGYTNKMSPLIGTVKSLAYHRALENPAIVYYIHSNSLMPSYHVDSLSESEPISIAGISSSSSISGATLVNDGATAGVSSLSICISFVWD